MDSLHNIIIIIMLKKILKKTNWTKWVYEKDLFKINIQKKLQLIQTFTLCQELLRSPRKFQISLPSFGCEL